MNDDLPDSVTRLLNSVSEDGGRALDALLPLVYEELRRIAAVRMQGESRARTWQPTALVHEAYMRLVEGRPVRWESRGHFYSVAAEAMRRILIDEARKRNRLKRGGSGAEGEGPERHRLPMSVIDAARLEDPLEILALDDAIQRLDERDGRVASVVRLRFYAGLSIAETADALGISERTAKREWTFARAWLFRALGEGDEVEVGPEES